MSLPWWRSREYQEYLSWCAKERHRREAERLGKQKEKVFTEKEIREKLIDLRETLDTFKGQRVPTNIIPLMRDLHKELEDAGYFRSLKAKKKSFLKRLFKR